MSPDQIERLAGPSRPLGSPDIPQFFLPSGRSAGVYAPFLYGAARIQFGDRRRKLDELRRVAFLLPLEPATKVVDWDLARATEITPDALLATAPKSGRYLPLPAGAMDRKVLARWAKSFDRWLARTQRLDFSKPDAPEPVSIGPKRGGVTVELVAIAWDLG